MEQYDFSVQTVIDTLKKYGYGQASISVGEECYKRLKNYLESCGVFNFSSDAAQQWLKEEVNDKKKRCYKKAIDRLVDVYEHGRVLGSHFAMYVSPSDEFIQEINDYLESIQGNGYAASSLANIKGHCKNFCAFMKCNGVLGVKDISYEKLGLYALYSQECGGHYIRNGLVRNFLLYLENQGKCTPGFGLFLRHGQPRKHLFLEDFPDNAVYIFQEHSDASKDFPACEFYATINGFLDSMREHRYCDAMILHAMRCLNNLYLFLDVNQMGYDPIIAKEWFSVVMDDLFAYNIRIPRRILEMYDAFIHENTLLPDNRTIHYETRYDKLPAWCKTEVDLFVNKRRKEGVSQSTQDMDRCCCTRFCSFLAVNRLEDFGALTPALIKAFNLQDKHKTIEGKNACNGRIRKFLIHLELREKIQAGLHFALPRTAVAGGRIVEALNAEDLHALEEYCACARGPLGLRDVAIARLGTDMGFRASDIVGLMLRDINWKDKMIRIVQKKTRVGHWFPMNIRTGNAIYRYLRDGRPKGISDEHVFVKVMAPYTAISAAVCKSVLERAHLSTRKFHKTRKTFASDMLNHGASVDEIAEALGHADRNNVHKYTELDAERMKDCPLTLSEAGLPLDGRYGHE